MPTFDQIAIFDLDGTLIDSAEQIAINLNKARVDYGFNPKPLIYYQELIGLPVYDLLADIEIPENELSDLVVHFRNYLLEDIQSGNNIVFPGVMKLLEFFVRERIGLAIATSKPSGIANEVVRCSLLRKFNFHIQGTDDFPSKPDPEVISRVVRHFPSIPAFMVGDRNEDVMAAKGAGVPSIGVAASAHSTEQLKSHGALLTFNSFDDFYENIHKDFDLIRRLGF